MSDEGRDQIPEGQPVHMPDGTIYATLGRWFVSVFFSEMRGWSWTASRDTPNGAVIKEGKRHASKDAACKDAVRRFGTRPKNPLASALRRHER